MPQIQNAFDDVIFDNSFSRLPACFYTRINPTPVSTPSFLCINENLASEIGMNIKNLYSRSTLNVFSGNTMPKKSQPLAMVYAGHQFGHFVPQLGDGRANLVGEIFHNNADRVDMQLKGSGITPYSRRGDGRAALGPVLREYIVSEAMHALGINSTRSLAAVLTGESVSRESLQPGAILTRIAKSHIRVGTFEYFSGRGEREHVKILADYVIDRHYPELVNADNAYLHLLEKVCDAQADLIASWMGVGFIHGVMNTDNSSIIGETIDYGPCAFMDEYQHLKTFSSIDRGGRYGFGNQARIGAWNMARFAETILPLIDLEQNKAIEKATQVIHHFDTTYHASYLKIMCTKLGLIRKADKDVLLIDALLILMEKHSLDFTRTFRSLTQDCGEAKKTLFVNLHAGEEGLHDWYAQWQERLKYEKRTAEDIAKTMASVNPVYIPRNHRIADVIKSAVDDNDFLPLHTLNAVLSSPYRERKEYDVYEVPPNEKERVCETFCGT